MREIARRIARSPSTVSRELTHNAATRGGCLEYRASVAQWKAERFVKRPKPAKLATNAQLRQYVQERLEGKVHDAEGRKIAGPGQAPFKGRNKPHRGDRKWVNGWSLVTRVAGDGDQRSWLVVLTRRGVATADAATGRIAHGLVSLLEASGLSAKEFSEADAHLRRVLGKLT